LDNIQIDFVSDWKEEMVKEMKEEGIQTSNTLSKDSLIIRYFTYLRKKGVPQSRNVYISKEFKCPPEHEKGLEKLIKVLKNGGDISPYLSKQIDNLTFNDGMFNDWGILHLHLGEEMEEGNIYIERTGPLLFAYFKDNNAYLINVFLHKEWTKIEVLQTIQNNWPRLIEPFKLKGFVGLAQQYTEKQHQQLRNAGVTVMMELQDDTGAKFPIVPIGMGIAASGDSTNDVRNYHDQIQEIRKTEELVKDNLDYIKNNIIQNGMNVPESLKFKLINENGQWIVKEVNTDLSFELISNNEDS
jgi:hypothetical protein